MFLSLKTLYRKRTVIWPFYFYTIIRTLSFYLNTLFDKVQCFNFFLLFYNVILLINFYVIHIKDSNF
ncbi:hypothetical protein D3233_05450 [Staphylococcus aureus]|nr:hypothetical protein D3234_08190 [Staphylococcus aureus]RIX91752.1 hypothetical protein D3233_05450 [Staphylococcus aureus]